MPVIQVCGGGNVSAVKRRIAGARAAAVAANAMKTQSSNQSRAETQNVRLAGRYRETVEKLRLQQNRYYDDYDAWKLRLLGDIDDIKDCLTDGGRENRDRHKDLTYETARKRVLRPLVHDAFYLVGQNKFALRRAKSKRETEAIEFASNTIKHARHVLQLIKIERQLEINHLLSQTPTKSALRPNTSYFRPDSVSESPLSLPSLVLKSVTAEPPLNLPKTRERPDFIEDGARIEPCETEELYDEVGPLLPFRNIHTSGAKAHFSHAALKKTMSKMAKPPFRATPENGKLLVERAFAKARTFIDDLERQPVQRREKTVDMQQQDVDRHGRAIKNPSSTVQYLRFIENGDKTRIFYEPKAEIQI